MHLSWRSLEELSCADMSAWRRYALYPHLLFCAKCRKELKEHADERELVVEVKAAYARGENVHMIMTSKGQ